MNDIELAGLVHPNLLATFKSLLTSIQDTNLIYFAFVMRQELDIAIGTKLYITYIDAAINQCKNRFELLAVTQQFDKPMLTIPHGWNTICALKFLGDGPCLLDRLPFIDEWYAQNRGRMFLTIED